MTRPLRIVARALLAATALAGASCTENNQSVFIDGFLQIREANSCEVTADQGKYATDGLVDTTLLEIFSARGFMAAPRVRNNMVPTATPTAIERNNIFPKALEVELKPSAGKTLPALPGLAGKYSLSFAFPSIDPGGVGVAVVELVPKATLLAAASSLGDPSWDGVLVASVVLAYEHAGSTERTGAQEISIRIAPNSLSQPIGSPCPVGGFTGTIHKACIIGQDEEVTCCTQGNTPVCGDGVPVSTGGNPDGG